MSALTKQLTKEYHAKPDPKFLTWYFKTFTNDRMMYCHWPVGGCDQDFEEYHQDVAEKDGKAFVYHNTPIGEDMYAATWHRNTNSTAVALGGFLGATTSDLGPNCARPEEIQLYIETISQDCMNLHVPVGQVWSHAEIADEDGYGPKTTCERWDLYCWVDPKTLKLIAATNACPAGWVYFMDWIRGEAILLIEKSTEKKWNI